MAWYIYFEAWYMYPETWYMRGSYTSRSGTCFTRRGTCIPRSVTCIPRRGSCIPKRGTCISRRGTCVPRRGTGHRNYRTDHPHRSWGSSAYMHTLYGSSVLIVRILRIKRAVHPQSLWDHELCSGLGLGIMNSVHDPHIHRAGHPH